MSNSSNPFDFSDFQPQHEATASSPGYGSPSFGGGFSAPDSPTVEFDPFADQTFAGGPPGGAAPSTDRFGQYQSGSTSTLDDEVACPPILWCALAAVVAISGIVLAVLGSGSIVIAASGWALAGPVAIGLLAVHTASDTKRRAKPFYSEPGWSAVVYWSVLGLAIIGVVLGALRIADWAGRL